MREAAPKKPAAGKKPAAAKNNMTGKTPAAAKNNVTGKTPAAAKKPVTGKTPAAAKKLAAGKAGARPEKKKGIQVPPPVPVPLFSESGEVVIREAILANVLGVTSTLPEGDLPEVAFAGRSNVGKSSLLNALVQRKALARTSAQPGKTRTINYYRVNGSLYFVDLPGYGYATAGEQEKAAWGRMIERYLHRSGTLKLVFLLVDSRHAPTENDLLMYSWVLSRNLQPVIIATKCDKLKKSQVPKQLKLIRDTLSLPEETPLILFSAETRQGRDEVFRLIDRCCFREASAE